MNTNKTPANRADIRSQASAWWVRVDSGTMSASEQAKFEAWLKNPLHRDAFGQVGRLWQELDGIKERLAAAPPPPPRKTRRLSLWQRGMAALAACCLLFVLIAPTALWLSADETTGIGEMRTVRLSDGSTIHLNSESAVSADMTKNTRKLTLLQGEALFKVSPDPARPFQVRAGNGTITALGTAFNVRHSHDGTEITVTEHSVAVNLDQDSAKGQAAIVVASGQQVSYTGQAGLGAIRPVDTQLTTAWQHGKLIFQDKALGEVIAELNHYHRGYFLISDPQITQRRVNGVFSTDKPVAALDAIEKSLHLQSTRLSHYLVLLHR